LRTSEVRYRRLFETAQDGILILDGATGAITDANPFLLSMLGYELRELLGHKLWEIGPFRDIENSQRAFGILQHDDYIRYENLPLQSKEGKKMEVEFVSNAYPVDGLRVIQCNIRDISERKKAERAFQAANLQLQRVLSQGPVIIYSLKAGAGEKGPFRYISDNIGQMLGYEALEAYRAGWWLENIHPEDAPQAIAERGALLVNGYANCDYRFRQKENGYRWIRDEQRLTRDSQDEPCEIVGTWTDITERKSLEDQLRQATKMEAIGRLAGGVAHDFNNLLSVIIGYSQMIRLSDSLSPEVREQSEQIYLAAERAVSLTRQLLSFGRKQHLCMRTADLNLVVTGISKMLARVLGEDITLKVECSAELLLVDADENLLEQILTNLSVNARDAMSEGGRLSITTGRINIDPTSAEGRVNARAGDFVWMRVRDDGIGMTQDTRAHIFEPFFTTKDVGRGTGLGLPTVYGIVQQHSGWIEVESELGVGSSFTVFFPAALSLRATLPLEKSGKFLASGNETILLVEDELSLQKMTSRVLKNLGYRVIAANDARSALLKWAQHPGEIDLLLTDIVMPGGMAGTDLAVRLRDEDPSLPIVLTSGYSTVQPEHFALKDAVRFMPKPYTLETLSRFVRDSIDDSKRSTAQDMNSQIPIAAIS
jgi:two-component system, cell cycle sensor histidine kinase and response regulator CckA